MPHVDLDKIKLTFQQKRLMNKQGYVYIGMYPIKSTGNLEEHYAFKCKKHGIVVDYPQGFHTHEKGGIPVCLKRNGNTSSLFCPKCQEEIR